MTDWPEAVREWEENIRFPHGSMYKSYKDMRAGADAAIAALKVVAQEAFDMLDEERVRYAEALNRAEEAEAENERLTKERDRMHTLMWRIARRYGPPDKTASRVIQEEADLARRVEEEHGRLG